MCMFVLWKQINHICSLKAVTMLSDCCPNKTRIQKFQENRVNFLASVLILTCLCTRQVLNYQFEFTAKAQFMSKWKEH